MAPIKDYTAYNHGMHRGMKDKMFFVDFLRQHPEVSNFVDFGCADGMLLARLHEIMPRLNLHGIDMNKNMLARAFKNVPSANLYVSQDMIYPTMPGTTALNLSSVLHEVFSYSTPCAIDRFFGSINYSDYEYIFVRDMNYDDTYENNVPEIDKKIFGKIDWLCGNLREDYENTWSTDISLVKKELIHFLLKYTYVTNWDRECRENYFSYSIPQLQQFLSNYEMVEFERYILPFKKRQVWEDFGYELNTPTHFKAIFKRKNRSNYEYYR